MNKTKRGPGQPKKHEQKLVQANFRVLATKRNDFRIKVNSFLKEYQI